MTDTLRAEWSILPAHVLEEEFKIWNTYYPLASVTSGDTVVTIDGDRIIGYKLSLDPEVEAPKHFASFEVTFKYDNNLHVINFTCSKSLYPQVQAYLDTRLPLSLERMNIR